MAANEPDTVPSDAEAEPSPEEPLDADAAAISRRSELLAPLVTRLGRALKRALQDDQNELLDAIRHASGAPDLDKLLPADQQRERLESASAPVLTACFTAGRPWLRAGEQDDDTPDDPDRASEAGTAQAAELSAELSSLLRHRLSESLGVLTDVSDGGQDRAGAAYREWKGQRIGALATDFAIGAFSLGALAGATGTAVRWVMDDDGQPCPDCDDNALAGDQLAGDVFPTGQAHPPVHPGCRCLLVSSGS